MYEEDDSWEVRAFEEDTLGCTWPPRSYSCTFCKREFRSAQALGGHMNVHRRDRAKMHGINMSPLQFSQLLPVNVSSSKHHISSSLSPIIIPTQELIAGGLCLLYPFPNPNPNNSNGSFVLPSSSMSHNHQLMFPPMAAGDNELSSSNSSLHQSANNNEETLGFISVNDDGNNNFCGDETGKDSAIEELDLELRLGRRSSSTPLRLKGRKGGV